MLSRKFILLFLLLFVCCSVSAVAAVNCDGCDDDHHIGFLTFKQWVSRYCPDVDYDHIDPAIESDYRMWCEEFGFTPVF